MSTNCNIGIVQEHRGVKAIFCHWDGYPEWAGKILQEHYQNPEKVRDLIAHGDLSALGPEIGTYNTFGPEYNQKVCLFYARDRQETGCEPIAYDTLHDWLEAAKGQCAEYAYLFFPETELWLYHSMRWDESRWAVLEEYFQKTSEVG